MYQKVMAAGEAAARFSRILKEKFRWTHLGFERKQSLPAQFGALKKNKIDGGSRVEVTRQDGIMWSYHHLCKSQLRKVITSITAFFVFFDLKTWRKKTEDRMRNKNFVTEMMKSQCWHDVAFKYIVVVITLLSEENWKIILTHWHILLMLFICYGSNSSSIVNSMSYRILL